MGIGKGGSSGPPAPNPAAMAAAQGAANKDAAITQARLNMINQFTPTGSLTFKQIGAKDGVPQFSATTDLSPMQDWLFRRGEDTQAHLLDVGRRKLNQVDRILGMPLNFSGAPRAQMPGRPGAIGGQIPRSVAVPNFGNLPHGPAIPGNINLGGLPAGGDIPEASDAVRRRTENAMFQRARAQLDPQFQDRQRELETQLVNQGFSRGSEGFSREQDRFRQNQNDAYQAALQDAIMFGGQEQSRLFEMGGQQFAMSEQQRQRALGEQLARFGVGAQRFGMGQQARKQRQGEVESLFNMRGTRFDQNMLRRNQRLAEQAQRFGQQSQFFGLGQQARQQAIQEMLLKRGVPLNELATIAGQNAGAALPQFSPVPQMSVAAPDVMGAMALQQQARQNAWNQQQANNQALMGAVGNVAGAGLGAWLSDPEAKTDVEPVSGNEALAKVLDLPVSEWRYKGDTKRHVGPMADDFAKAAGGDGRTIDPISAFGLSVGAIQALARKVNQLERRAA
jgi:hypothetical protein